MSGKSGQSRWLLLAAAVILAGTGALHGLGYRPVSGMLAGSGIDPGWAGGLKGLWIIFSVHLALLAVILALAASRPESAGRRVLIVCGLIPAADTLILLRFVGMFPGSILLGIVTILVFAAIAVRPRE